MFFYAEYNRVDRAGDRMEGDLDFDIHAAKFGEHSIYRKESYQLGFIVGGDTVAHFGNTSTRGNSYLAMDEGLGDPELIFDQQGIVDNDALLRYNRAAKEFELVAIKDDTTTTSIAKISDGLIDMSGGTDDLRIHPPADKNAKFNLTGADNRLWVTVEHTGPGIMFEGSDGGTGTRFGALTYYSDGDTFEIRGSDGSKPFLGSENGRLALYKDNAQFFMVEDGLIDMSGGTADTTLKIKGGQAFKVNNGTNDLMRLNEWGLYLSDLPSPYLVWEEGGNEISYGVNKTDRRHEWYIDGGEPKMVMSNEGIDFHGCSGVTTIQFKNGFTLNLYDGATHFLKFSDGLFDTSEATADTTLKIKGGQAFKLNDGTDDLFAVSAGEVNIAPSGQYGRLTFFDSASGQAHLNFYEPNPGEYGFAFMRPDGVGGEVFFHQILKAEGFNTLVSDFFVDVAAEQDFAIRVEDNTLATPTHAKLTYEFAGKAWSREVDDGAGGRTMVERVSDGVLDLSGMTIPSVIRFKHYAQAAQPALANNGEMAVWEDTDDSNRTYLIVRTNGVDRKVELSA